MVDSEGFGLSPGRLELPLTQLRKVINGAGLEGTSEIQSGCVSTLDIHVELLSGLEDCTSFRAEVRVLGETQVSSA